MPSEFHLDSSLYFAVVKLLTLANLVAVKKSITSLVFKGWSMRWLWWVMMPSYAEADAICCVCKWWCDQWQCAKYFWLGDLGIAGFKDAIGQSWMLCGRRDFLGALQTPQSPESLPIESVAGSAARGKVTERPRGGFRRGRVVRKRLLRHRQWCYPLISYRYHFINVDAGHVLLIQDGTNKYDVRMFLSFRCIWHFIWQPIRQLPRTISLIYFRLYSSRSLLSISLMSSSLMAFSFWMGWNMMAIRWRFAVIPSIGICGHSRSDVSQE